MGNKPSRVTFRKRLDDMVLTLREEIVSGKLGVGQFLPSENSLGEQFKLSKNSVRKGLDILVTEQFIRKVPRVGNQVTKPAAEGMITLRLGCYRNTKDEAVIDQLLTAFQLEYPHIRVEIVPLPFTHYYEMASEYLERNLLDVAVINNNHFQQFLEEGQANYFEPLTLTTDTYSFVAHSFQYNDEILAHPFIFSPVVLCYNRDHFMEKNIAEPDSSWRWDDLMAAAAQLADDSGRYGFFFHLLSDNRWPIFLLQSGMTLKRDKGGQVHLYGTKMMESMNVCRELTDQAGIFPAFMSERDEDTVKLFQEGRISMMISSYFNLNHISKPHFSFDVAPLPYLYEPRTLLLTIGLFVNRNSKAKQAAHLLLDYLCSYSSQLIIRQQTYSIPCDKRAAEWTGEERLKRPRRYYMYREIVPTFRLFTELQLRTSEMDIFRNEMKYYWSRMEDERYVCKRLEQLLSEEALLAD